MLFFFVNRVEDEFAKGVFAGRSGGGWGYGGRLILDHGGARSTDPEPRAEGAATALGTVALG